MVYLQIAATGTSKPPFPTTYCSEDRAHLQFGGITYCRCTSGCDGVHGMRCDETTLLGKPVDNGIGWHLIGPRGLHYLFSGTESKEIRSTLVGLHPRDPRLWKPHRHRQIPREGCPGIGEPGPGFAVYLLARGAVWILFIVFLFWFVLFFRCTSCQRSTANSAR